MRSTLILGIALLGCSSLPAEPAVCTGPVTIQVGAGARPLVSWTPACAANAVFITDAADTIGTPVWAVFATPPAGIAPPIQYGSSPSGLLDIVFADSLTIGQTYTAYVTRGLRTLPGFGDDSLHFVAR